MLLIFLPRTLVVWLVLVLQYYKLDFTCGNSDMPAVYEAKLLKTCLMICGTMGLTCAALPAVQLHLPGCCTTIVHMIGGE